MGYYTYDAQKRHRLEAIYADASHTNETHRFSYDAHGNITGDGERTLSYTSFDKPSRVERGVNSAEMSYGPNREMYFKREVTQALYDPWGQRHAILQTNALQDLVGAAATERGYTGHTHMRGLELIHMGGRTYDPVLGRFLQADPFMQSPENLQNHNRYSYVLNNPMSYVDPSGYFFDKLWDEVRPFVGAIVGAALVAFGAPLSVVTAAWYGAIAGAAGAAANGGNILSGALMGAYSGIVFYGIGTEFKYLAGQNGRDFRGVLGTGLSRGQFGAKVLAHGTAGGVMSVMSNGKFGHGFAAAGTTQLLSPGIGWIDGDNPGAVLGRVSAAAVVGGTAAKVSGGKFANGAITGAVSYAFGEAARRASGPPGRALTANEMAEAQSVFGDRIDYSQARIINGKYFFLQGSGYAMAPDGNIYWPGACSDLATCGGGASAGTFIHEMTHVMQHQNGVNVLGRGFLLQAGHFLSFGLYDPYSYTYDPARSFSSYNIEQQGDIARGIYYGRHPNNIDY